MKLFYLALFSVSLGVAQPVISNVRAFPSSNEITVRADITGAPITALKFNYGTTAAMGLPDWAQGDWVTWNTPGTNEYELHSSTYYVPTPGTPYYFQISAVWAGGTVSSTCTNGQTGKGWTCQPGGGVHTLTTSANGIAPAFHEVRAYPSHGSVMVRAILTNFSMIAQSLVLETGT